MQPKLLATHNLFMHDFLKLHNNCDALTMTQLCLQ